MHIYLFAYVYPLVAHKVGHVLGFDHPDTAPGENLEQVANLTNATCRSPWSVAQLTDYTQTEEGSIMHSLTRHNPVTCLSTSDMNGLYLLYPVCDEIIPTDVSCSKARRLSGFLRLASVVGLPLFIALLLVLLPLSCLRWRDARRIKNLTQDVEEAGSAMRSLRRTFAAGATSSNLSTNLFRPLSRGISHMGSISSFRGPNSFTRSNRVAPLPPNGAGAGQAAIDAATAAIIAEASRGGNPGITGGGRAGGASQTQCRPFQPAGAGGTQPGAGSDNDDANGLLVIEELDDDVQARVKSFALPSEGGAVAAAEVVRRSAFADMLAPSNAPLDTRNTSDLDRPQRTPSQRTPL